MSVACTDDSITYCIRKYRDALLLFGYMTYLNAELGPRVSKGVVVMVGFVECSLPIVK